MLHVVLSASSFRRPSPTGAARASGQVSADKYERPMIRAVVFDVGERLVDATREYGTWADWLGMPRHTRSQR